MIQIEIKPKIKNILLIAGTFVFACSVLLMTLFVQKLIYNLILTKVLHVSGQFEYWREIMLNFSFTFAVISALFLLVIAKA